MNHTTHPSNNAYLGAPKDWNADGIPCDTIGVTHHEIEGMPVVVSFWHPTPEELALLNARGKVALWVYGTNMPPVALAVEP